MFKHKIKPRAQLPNEDVRAAEGHSVFLLGSEQQKFRTDEIKRVKQPPETIFNLL